MFQRLISRIVVACNSASRHFDTIYWHVELPATQQVFILKQNMENENDEKSTFMLPFLFDQNRCLHEWAFESYDICFKRDTCQLKYRERDYIVNSLSTSSRNEPYCFTNSVAGYKSRLLVLLLRLLQTLTSSQFRLNHHLTLTELNIFEISILRHFFLHIEIKH